jgi:hypothetical protein
VKKLIVILLAALAAYAAAPNDAHAGRCGLPEERTMWIDFADGSVPFWTIFAKPGIVAAAAQLIYPPQLRAGGAQTVYFDLYFRNRVGTSTAPADPGLIVGRANTFFDYAVQSTGCATPFAAFNELAGPGLATPWTDRYAQYRANVLLFLKTFAERGGRPFLLLPGGEPATSGEAADWWREAAKYADLVPEVYFNAPNLYKQGPVLATRNIRQAFRRRAADFLAIGIPARKIGIMLGFQVAKGAGGREGLARDKWYETVKWQSVAAAQVSGELRLATVWSWGWGTWSDASNDGDKLGAACIYLWTRNPALCNAPGAVPGFDPSTKDAKLVLPAGTQCLLGSQAITSNAIAQHAAVVGDREAAYTLLYARAVESALYPIATDRVLAAERAVIDFHFGGSAAAYRAALSRRHATVAVARGALGDELRHAEIELRMRVGAPSGSAVTSFYNAYASLLTREVVSARATTWLGGRVRGLTLASLAPPPVFAAREGASRTIRWAGESYDVKPVGLPRPLGALPLELVRPAIAAQLVSYARNDAYHVWTAKVQETAMRRLACRRDALPQPGEVELADWLPFLALS